MMILDNAFEIGQTVYLKTDRDQLPRIVTGIKVRPGGLIIYDLAQSSNETLHYEMEISTEVDVLITSTN